MIYLYRDSLVFAPYKSKKYTTHTVIPLADTEQITSSRHSDWRIPKNTAYIQFTLKSGQIEKFIVDKDDSLYQKILALKPA